jgi:hypothetical protein
MNKPIKTASIKNLQRKIFFHCGAGKTGSSALQAFLNVNKSALNICGISYMNNPEVSRQDEITSGNGGLLLAELQNPNTTEKALDFAIESYFLNNLEAICSSELLSWLTDADWLKVKESCDRLQINAVCVSFIRSVQSCYLSAYHQMVKRHGEYRSFEEFVEITPNIYNHLKHVKAITKVFGKENIRVLHYESTKKSMDRAFFSAIDRKCESLDRSILNQTINRSLSNHELRVLKKVNRISGDIFSQNISDMLIYARPNLHMSIEKNAEVGLIMAKRHDADIDWVNITYFKGESILTVDSSQSTNDVVTVIPEDEILKVDDDVLIWCIHKLATLQENITAAMGADVAKLIQIIMDQSPEIARDFFDIDYYLKTNPDVAEAGVDPTTHYFENGMFEGRLPSENIDDFLRLAWKARGDMLRYGLKKVGQQLESFKIEVTNTKQEIYDQLITANQAHLQERLQIQESYELAINLKDRQVTELAKVHRARDDQYIERERWQLEQSAQLQNKYESTLLLLGEREKDFGVQKQELLSGFHMQFDEQNREHSVHLQELSAQLMAKQDNLHALTLQWIEKENSHLNHSKELLNELNSVRNTRVWRWSAPFRIISNWLGR